jgi:hypothetical protein
MIGIVDDRGRALVGAKIFSDPLPAGVGVDAWIDTGFTGDLVSHGTSSPPFRCRALRANSAVLPLSCAQLVAENVENTTTATLMQSIATTRRFHENHSA